IPSNFKSSGAFNMFEIKDDEIVAELILIDDKELADYQEGSSVEVFGANSLGLIYFETKILKRENKTITLAITPDYSLIQRREYSRVGLTKGNIEFKDFSPNSILKVEDISAGGIKLILDTPLELEKYYDTSIKLSNNMNIECALAPIRIKEIDYDNKKAYLISGKFVNLDNADRIVLIQYAFKIKMEEQNKEDN
ncbi:MAG: PilZ domain-containing protein, partial [Candidatus Gastranaerophilales bacterium]|nr:PilZ domain-containing protein [Candidatus Gastranaerophilales bacterium]